MKIRIALAIFILFSANVLAQNKPTGKFEYTDFSSGGVGEKFSINFSGNDSFHLERFYEQICYRTTENINGIFKMKKDTIVLITPLSKIFFTTSNQINLTRKEFIYSINNFKHIEFHNLNNYLIYLDFYFLDKNLNLNKIKPVEVNTVIDTSIKYRVEYSEINFKFIIPSNVTHFIARQEYDASTTFDINDIKGKRFTDIIRSKEDRFDNRLKNCIDITYERYILNENKTCFSSVDECPAQPSYQKIVTFKRM